MESQASSYLPSSPPFLSLSRRIPAPALATLRCIVTRHKRKSNKLELMFFMQQDGHQSLTLRPMVTRHKRTTGKLEMILSMQPDGHHERQLTDEVYASTSHIMHCTTSV